MSGTIKAIETRYAGYRFRSRLEARWAVFFDTLGLKWQYEPEGYELDPDIISEWEQAEVNRLRYLMKAGTERYNDQGDALITQLKECSDELKTHGKYLPDFYIPAFKAYVEIKGTDPTPLEIARVAVLGAQMGATSVITEGCPNEEPMHVWCDLLNLYNGFFGWFDGCVDHDGHERVGIAIVLDAQKTGKHSLFVTWDNFRNGQLRPPEAVTSLSVQARVREACKAARSARFEHGENG